MLKHDYKILLDFLASVNDVVKILEICNRVELCGEEFKASHRRCDSFKHIDTINSFTTVSFIVNYK